MTSKSVCPQCGCEAGAHFMSCPRVGGPISFAFDGLFARDKENDFARDKENDAMSWHPMQPIIRDKQGIIRFRKNKIVRLLLETSHLNLNSLKIMLDEGMVSQADYTHLTQLIGYSVDGYAELSTSPPELVETADRVAAQLLEKT